MYYQSTDARTGKKYNRSRTQSSRVGTQIGNDYVMPRPNEATADTQHMRPLQPPR